MKPKMFPHSYHNIGGKKRKFTGPHPFFVHNGFRDIFSIAIHKTQYFLFFSLQEDRVLHRNERRKKSEFVSCTNPSTFYFFFFQQYFPWDERRRSKFCKINNGNSIKFSLSLSLLDLWVRSVLCNNPLCWVKPDLIKLALRRRNTNTPYVAKACSIVEHMNMHRQSIRYT